MAKLVLVIFVITSLWCLDSCIGFSCYFCNHFYPENCPPEYTMDCEFGFCLTISTWRVSAIGAWIKQYIRACPTEQNDTCHNWANTLEAFNDTFQCQKCYTDRCNNGAFMLQRDTYGNVSFKEPHDYNSVNLTEIMGPDSGY